MEVFFKNKDIKLVPGAKSQRDVFQSGRVSGKQIDLDCENWNGLGKEVEQTKLEPRLAAAQGQAS